MSLFLPCASPTLILPPCNLTVPQFILDGLCEHPTRIKRKTETPCFIEEETGRLVYISQLRTRTDALARAFHGSWGIVKGDVVALYAPNHVDYVIIAWAVHRLGGLVATMSPSLTAEELKFQLEITRPTAMVAHVDNLFVTLQAAAAVSLPHSRIAVLDGETSPTRLSFKSIDELIQQRESFPSYTEVSLDHEEAKRSIAFLCFSSGTTGNPKAVAVSHYNVNSMVVQVATFSRANEEYAAWENRRFRAGDVCSGVLPLYHVFGLVVNLHLSLFLGMAVVIRRQFNYERFLQSIAKFRITHLFIVPAHIVLFCKHPATKKCDLSSVRFCLVGAAPLSSEITGQFLAVLPGIEFGQGYGMTETGAAATMFPTTQREGTPGSAGHLLSGTVAKVVKSDGSLAGVGEQGELFLQGPQIVPGYYKNNEATRDTFVDGWLRTGDEVLFRENGDMFVIGRIKELIKVKGLQVSPSEIEGHLLDHPDVADAAVIGIPDNYAGEVPLAYVVLKPDTARAIIGNNLLASDIRASIIKHVVDAKSQYKWLTGGVEFIDSVPKNASGKILRRVLQERSKYLRLPGRARL